MNRTRKTLMMMLICLFGCSPSSEVVAQSATIWSVSGSGRAHLLRERNTTWQPIRKGTAFRQGDQIWIDKSKQVFIKCPNEPVMRVRARRPKGFRSICLRWVYRDWKGTQAVSTLGGIDGNIPYLITPRHSLILNPQPLLRWHPVPNASIYTVVVHGPGGAQWRTQTSEAQVKYAGPALVPGVPYSLTVTTDMGVTSQADTAPNGNRAANLDFRLLHSEEAALIQSEVAQLTSGPINDVSTILAVARLYGDFVLPQRRAISDYGLSEKTYQTYSLTADAIALLDKALQEHSPSPLLHRTLGDLYWQTGLLQLAVAQYQQAIEQTEGLVDLEDWTLSHAVLGKIYTITKDYPGALQHYRQARVGYRFLGNEGLAKNMQRIVERLERQLESAPQ